MCSQRRDMTRLIQPSPRLAALFVSAALLVALVGATIFFLPDLVVGYYQGWGGAALRARLGFELELIPVDVDGSARQVWVFSNLRADGPLARAGVRAGDAYLNAVVPTHPSFLVPEVARIYRVLEGAESGTVSFRVVDSRKLGGAWWQSVRDISLSTLR